MPLPVLDRFLLTGKAAVVTGGGSGIGRAAALTLAAAGARVTIFDRAGDAATAVAAEIAEAGGTASSQAVDVSDEGELERAFAAAVAQMGSVDVLVNNAGIAIRQPASDLPLPDWERVMAVNLTGMFLAARIAARTMLARGSGAIVNTASIMGLSGGIYPNVAYQTSKGGVVNLTRALAIEWAPAIRVNAVAPTYVDTPFISALKSNPQTMGTILAATPLGRLAQPDEVAFAILFLSSPAAAMITGAILPVDGGFLAR